MLLVSANAVGGVTVYEKEDAYVKVGGRIQLQYQYADPDTGNGSDSIFFRRLRPYIEASVHPDWKGKFQWDMGKAKDDNEISIKDAYMQYSGIEGVKISIGNALFPFSREFLTSSKKQQLVERTFVGDHNYGTPLRTAGVHLNGENGDAITWGASFASASIDPDEDKLDFDNPINKDSDFNEGWIYGGRVDFHPLGILKFSQGHFTNDTKATISAAAFQWNNDNDNNTNQAGKPDIDNITGFEISGAFRSSGLSVDAEYNRFDADTVNETYTGGIHQNGGTVLENWAVEGGYMIIPNRLELVAGYQNQDADGYADEWIRTSVGANWFIHKHDLKFQLTYRMGENVKGVTDVEEDEIFLQSQFVF